MDLLEIILIARFLNFCLNSPIFPALITERMSQPALGVLNVIEWSTKGPKPIKHFVF